jgi:hypothetical protein
LPTAHGEPELRGCAHEEGLAEAIDERKVFRFQGTQSYLTNASLEAAVNAALALKKPLLVRVNPARARRSSPRPSPKRSAPS